MIKICFVCLGNICRSPMALFVMKNLVKEHGLEQEIVIDSRGTNAEVGCVRHHSSKRMLDQYHIPYKKHVSTQLKSSDYEEFDYFIGMDDYNIHDMIKIFKKGDKVYKLLDFTRESKDIADPWYTNNFEITYNEIDKGCRGLLEFLMSLSKNE